MRRRKYILASLVVLVSILSAFNAVAEEINKYGKSFAVDDLAIVDSTTMQISLFETQSIVNKDQLENYVVVQYLKNRPNEFNIEELYKFLDQAVIENNETLYVALANSIINHPGFNSKQLEEQLIKLSQSNDNLSTLKEMLLKVDSFSKTPEIISSLVFAISLKDIQWLKSKGVRFVYLNGAQVKKYFKLQFFYRIKNDADIVGAAKVLKALSGLYGPSDKLHLQLQVLLRKIDQGLKAIKKLEAEGMYTLLELCKSNARMSEILPPVMVKEAHETAENALEISEPLKALTVLSWLDVDWRTPRTHELTIKALKTLDVGSAAPVLGTRIENFLDFLSHKDNQVQTAYVTFLERQLLVKLNKNKLLEAESYLSKIIQVRPDPNRRNDVMRAKCAVALSTAGKKHAARRLYDDMKTMASPISFINLLLRGVIVDRGILLLFILIPVLFISWMIVSRRPVPVKVSVEDEDIVYGKDAAQNLSMFKRLSGKAADPVYLSYCFHLKKFNLDDRADLKTLKQAYRNAVKKVHPDTNPDLDKAGHEKFLDLTEAYERILRLRKRLGYPAE